MVTSNLRSLGEEKEKSWIKTDYGNGDEERRRADPDVVRKKYWTTAM